MGVFLCANCTGERNVRTKHRSLAQLSQKSRITWSQTPTIRTTQPALSAQLRYDDAITLLPRKILPLSIRHDQLVAEFPAKFDEVCHFLDTTVTAVIETNAYGSEASKRFCKEKDSMRPIPDFSVVPTNGQVRWCSWQ